MGVAGNQSQPYDEEMKDQQLHSQHQPFAQGAGSLEDPDSAFDTVTLQMADQVQQGIDQINMEKFEILAIQKFKNTNCFVQYVSMNEDCTCLLCTCSDRALRLYFIDFE